MAWHSWLTENRGASRLEKEFRLLSVEAERLTARPAFKASAECKSMQDSLASCSKSSSAKPRDVEGAWADLNAARMYLLYALRPDELAAKKVILLLEKDKVTNWRRNAIEKLLENKPGTAADVAEATFLLNEYNANQYYKIWLAADQLGILMWLSACGLALLVPLLVLVHKDWNASFHTGWKPAAWSVTMLSAVLFFGIEGGAFSVAQGLFPDLGKSKVPDRVANNWTMLIRALFGSVAGMAGYAFLQADLLKLRTILGNDDLATRLAVAFIFGYTGEKLISSVSSSLLTRAGTRTG